MSTVAAWIQGALVLELLQAVIVFRVRRRLHELMEVKGVSIRLFGIGMDVHCVVVLDVDRWHLVLQLEAFEVAILKNYLPIWQQFALKRLWAV